MAPIYRLTVLPYLQTWHRTTATLELNVLLFPTGDPRLSLTTGLGVPGPAIADASITLTANLSRAVDELPLMTTIDAHFDLPLTMPAGRHDVFDAMGDAFHPDGAEVPPVRDAAKTMSKYLTRSYREAFAFTSPKTALAITDDSFRCMLKCPPPNKPVPPAPHKRSWAEAIANASRLPLVMRRAGLLHTVTIPLPDPAFYADAGWLFFTLAASSDYAAAAALPNFFRTYATRVPSLSTTNDRSVFTAVLFPVFADATAASAVAGRYDEVFPEALTFDDGFSKIVHATQPRGMDHLDEEGSGAPPVEDRGVYLGWDDEDILIGQNRQIGMNPDGSEPADAPRGVNGYRIDVREVHTAGTSDWRTLSAVHTDHAKLAGLDLGPFDGELRTEVHPRSINERIWLPAWFASWLGGSMVTESVDQKLLRNVPHPATPLFDAVDEDLAELRYGRRYDFRVRMVDTTGGGPALGDSAFRGGEAPVARLHFVRRLRPKLLELTKKTSTSSTATLKLRRPKLAYPAAVFAGIPNAIDRLRAIQDNIIANPGITPRPGVALPDPDVEFAEVRVLVRPPAFDREDVEDGWRELYTTWRSFPADPDELLQIDAEFVDVAQTDDLDLSDQLGAPGTRSGAVVLPTARDVRLELRALGRDDLTYFADDPSRRSAPISVELHAAAAAETDLFRPADPSHTLRSVFLRNDPIGATPALVTIQPQNDPSPVLVERLASAIGMAASDSTIVAPAGRRVVFGCAGLKHRLSPDNGSLTLTHQDELANTWVNAVQLDLNRDWTWKGTICPTLLITRTIRFVRPGGASQTNDVGSIDLIHSISRTAVAAPPERDRTTLLFLDAFQPPLWHDLPAQLDVQYDVVISLENGTRQTVHLETMLPVTAPPVQVPEIVAAGYALSPYMTDDNYSTTAPRTRMLWLEFAAPPVDPRDSYFVRILAHAPDPLLLACAEPVADPASEPKSPLDPEPVRVIVPDQADDFAGLATMQKLIPASGSNRHYLVPLPPGTSPGSPELFGFYQYEVRVGHDRGTPADPFWSTAQGRFGPTLVIEGVQHPAPPLRCSATRRKNLVVASAPFATPFYNDTNVLPEPPNTEIWIVLYVQVHQSDRATMRNIQLDVRRAHFNPRLEKAGGVPRERQAEVIWPADTLHARLAALGLGERAPLSVLAVELLPEPNGGFQHPLSGDLGDVRILRTSPLAPVQQECC
jgi:hypothetical protein